MQDYFKYDKIQTGTSLFMKSDSDGSKDKENKGLNLGIKTVAQGIKHFTNWNNISNSIDANGGLRFDDSQANSLYFNMPHNSSNGYESATFTDVNDNTVNNSLNGKILSVPKSNSTYANEIPSSLAFKDSWEANDINIIDDIAFVSYEDYTDLHRKDTDLGTVQLCQPKFTYTRQVAYDLLTYVEMPFGSLVFRTDKLPPMNSIVAKTDGQYENSSADMTVSNDFAGYGNTILKIEFEGKTLYFTYGGARTRELRGGGAQEKSDSALRSSGQGPDTGMIEDKEHNQYCGKFYIVSHDPVSYNEDTFSKTEKIQLLTGGETASCTTHIELDVGSNKEGTDVISGSYGVTYFDGQPDILNTMINAAAYDIKATLIKIQPVRKCGKVDVYVRKTGIITAAVNNRFTSPGHKLETNDIIKISSALFDGTEEGALDRHPLNGEKFVKRIDDDTFDLYDDQFFEKASSTNKLKTTDGITWTCVSSSNGQFGQSWDFHKTIFSPTGRNGYATNGDKAYGNNYVANSSNFTTTNRIRNKVRLDKWSGNQDLFENNAESIHLNFTQSLLPTSDTASNTGFLISQMLDSIPESTFDRTLLDIQNKCPHDFYPYYCQSDSSFGTDDIHSPYQGSKFGCSLDVKFHKQSGDSKIYHIAIGERGSDLSVNIFGAIDNERMRPGSLTISGLFPNHEEFAADGDVPYAVERHDNNKYQLFQVFKERVEPNFLPHGKVHVLAMTVDKYGRITDISHKNTLFGDGSCCNSGNDTEEFDNYINANSNSEYPWARFVQQYKHIRNMKKFFDGNFLFRPAVQNVGNINQAPFVENFYDKTSLYWDRAAILHWFSLGVYDYWSNSTTNGNESQRLIPGKKYSDRNFTSTDDTDRSSYFGRQGIGNADNTPQLRIHRFRDAQSQWYICPWVDSFGASVALSGPISVDRNGSNQENFMVFGSTRTRSNIKNYGYNVDKNKRPIFTEASTYDLNEEESASQIGQITCSFIRKSDDVSSDYRPVQILEINSGGSADSSLYSSLNGNADNTTTTSFDGGITSIKLRESNKAGLGFEEVYSSCDLSAHTIKFKNGLLIWGDQVLADGKSSINLLKFDNVNKNSFSKITTIDSIFSTPRQSQFVGDGFGMDIRLSDSFLLTNGMRTTNDLGDDIGTALSVASGSARVDSLFVYNINYDSASCDFIQAITPSFNSRDTEKYTEKFINLYSDHILDINNVTYENDIFGSMSWNIKLLGRYDAISDKILLRDPIEYVLLGNDYSVINTIGALSPALSDSLVDPYLYFTEHFEDDTIYYDYSAKDEFLLKDTSMWEEFGINNSKVRNLQNSIKTPVFFLDLPSFGLDKYGDLNITISLDDVFSRFIKTIDLQTLNQQNVIDDSSTPLVPKLVLYKKDPRSMITPNGPAATSTNTEITPFTNGIFTYGSNQIDINDINSRSALSQPPLFRGGANDMFYYGSLCGSAPELTNYTTYMAGGDQTILDNDKDFLNHYYGGHKTLGELFDSSYNKAGNTNKGIISWMAPDVFDLISTEQRETIYPYAGLFINNGFNINDDNAYIFNIPYSSWKNYVIRGNLLKSSADDRALFNDFDRIKQGSLTANSPFAGTWDKMFNDINRGSYNPKKIIRDGVSVDIAPSMTLAVGFVLTTMSSVDLRNNQLITGSYGAGVGDNFRANISIPEGSNVPLQGVSKYPYSKIISTSDSSQSYTGAARRSLISHDLQSQIKTISFAVSRATAKPKRIKTLFHKIAYFEYDNSVYSDVQRSSLKRSLEGLDGQFAASVKRYSFGKFGFTPIPVGIPSPTDSSIGGNIRNPIIRAGKSKSSSHQSGGNNGTFSRSIQIISSDNLYNKSNDAANTRLDTSFYMSENQDDKLHYNISSTGTAIGTAKLYGQTLIGGFDIDDPEFLSLNVRGKVVKDRAATLFIRDTIVSGHPTIAVSGIGSSESNLDLWIGQHLNSGETPLFISAPDAVSRMSLYTFETQPSGSMSLFVIPPYNTGMTLTFTPQTTGVIPLTVIPPLQDSGDMPLNIRGKAFKSIKESLYTSGIGLQSNLMTTQIDGVIPHNNAMTLFMNKPQSGVTTLNVVGAEISSGSMPLVAKVKTPTTDIMPLHIGPEFNVSSQTSTLSIDTQKTWNSSSTVHIAGFIDSVNSLNAGETDYEVLRNDHLVDISSSSELAVASTYADFRTSKSNALTKNNIIGGYYSNKKKTEIRFRDNFTGNKLDDNDINPALKARDAYAGNFIGASFYDDHSPDSFNASPTINNKAIKTEMLDSDGKSVVTASLYDGLGQIDIYDIVDNSQVEINSSIYIAPAAHVLQTSSDPVIYRVKVQRGTNQFGYGNKYYINDKPSPVLTLEAGVLYRFDLSDISLTNHPLRFSETIDGTHNGGSSYTLDLTIVGTPGQNGAYVEIMAPRHINKLYYYCGHHAGMGAFISSTIQDDKHYNIYENVPGGDSFYALREDLKSFFDNELDGSTTYSPSDLSASSSKIYDLKVSDSGTIAISYGIRLIYDGNSDNKPRKTKIFNVIIIFNKSNILDGYNLSYQLDTHYVNSFQTFITEESNDSNSPDRIASAYNIAFSGEDLYLDKRGAGFAKVCRLSASENYSTLHTEIDFNSHPDANGYFNATNSPYISEIDRKVAFGVPIKIYDDIATGGKIMFVGAQLFDPYTFNSLSDTYSPSAIGAVYIYKQPLQNPNPGSHNAWNYFGAVYGKGNTSENIMTNLSDYSDSFEPSFGLFGYDFDYADGNLAVCEPGGNGTDSVNVGKVYLFDVTNSIVHLETYDGANLQLPDSQTLSPQDNFASSVLLLNSDNPITFANTRKNNTFGESNRNFNGIIYSLKGSSILEQSLKYNVSESPATSESNIKLNLKNENKYYEPSSMDNISDGVVIRTANLLFIKKLNFGNGSFKLASSYEFSTQVLIGGVSDFVLQKLFLDDIRQQAFSLFISGPQPINKGMDIAMLENFGITAGGVDLTIIPPETMPCSGDATLFLQQRQEIKDMSLFIDSGESSATTLYMSGSLVGLNNEIDLSIAGKPRSLTDTTLHVSGSDIPSKVATLQTKGLPVANFVDFSTLYIGQKIDHNASIDLTINAVPSTPPGVNVHASGLNTSIEGKLGTDYASTTSLFASGPDQAATSGVTSLFTAAPVPPTGLRGFAVSGDVNLSVVGDNDGSVFSVGQGFVGLSVKSTIGVANDTTLFIEKPTVNTMPLSIKDQSPSGFITTVIDGAFICSGDATLYVKPPPANQATLFIRPFLE